MRSSYRASTLALRQSLAYYWTEREGDDSRGQTAPCGIGKTDFLQSHNNQFTTTLAELFTLLLPHGCFTACRQHLLDQALALLPRAGCANAANIYSGDLLTIMEQANPLLPRKRWCRY